jgi:hypothetical protein
MVPYYLPIPPISQCSLQIILRDTIILPVLLTMAAVHGPILPAHPSPFRNAQSVPHFRMGYHPAPTVSL